MERLSVDGVAPRDHATAPRRVPACAAGMVPVFGLERYSRRWFATTPGLQATNDDEEGVMGTIEGWKAEEIYDVAHGNARHGDRHAAGLLAVAAEAERRGREQEAAMTLLMGPVVAAARHLLRAEPGDAKARAALRAAVDAYTDAALGVTTPEPR